MKNKTVKSTKAQKCETRGTKQTPKRILHFQYKGAALATQRFTLRMSVEVLRVCGITDTF